MALRSRGQWLPSLLSWVAIAVAFSAFVCNGSEVSLRFLKTPQLFSAFDSATFEFGMFDERNASALCSDCTISCKLDNNSFSDCNSGLISYIKLPDGDHTFEACISGSHKHQCHSYNWTIDTVPPTAYISAPVSFTNESNVSVHIVFSEACTGGGGFRCSSDYCNVLVYGAAHVFSNTLRVLHPDLEFSVQVGITTNIQYGRLVLVMDKNFCTDAAGNWFRRTVNSSFFLHFDRRQVFMNLRTYIPYKLLQIDGDTRRADVTNKQRDLRVNLYFSEPVLNSSLEVLNVLHASTGVLVPTNGSTLGNRRFGYKVTGVASMDIVTIYCATVSILSRQGTPVSVSHPFTFLYDAQRPSVILGTNANARTKERNISVIIKFVKPVFEFNSSSVQILGGHFVSFREISRTLYTGVVHANDNIVSIEIPENITEDIAGNKNLASNKLQVRCYSVPTISAIVSTIVTATFAATCMAAAILTISTASLLSFGVFSGPETYLKSETTKSLVRITCHIQVFALSKWLAIVIPTEYYELARGIEWSIPYINLPWEFDNMDSPLKHTSYPLAYSILSQGKDLNSFGPMTTKNGESKSALYRKPLTPMEYRLFLESQNMKPEAEFLITSQSLYMWKYFGRNMFWLALIGGGLIVLHVLFRLIIRSKRRNLERPKEFGALVFPRLEVLIFLLALPSICQASSTLIRGYQPITNCPALPNDNIITSYRISTPVRTRHNGIQIREPIHDQRPNTVITSYTGRSSAEIAVGTILVCIAAFFFISLLLFLSIGISLGKLLQYKEVHQEGQEFRWYNELVRVSLGPGKLCQWTWKGQSISVNLLRFGPLFEDLRGPPKYLLSQISTGKVKKRKKGEHIIPSEDENEDAEAPLIQKFFGILRVYYTFLESAKRALLGIVAGVYYKEDSSKVPTLIVLSITSFQLFFLVLKKPFIKRKVQLVEIISVTCEVGVIGSCLVLLESDVSDFGQKCIGYFMLALFVISFVAQMLNEWYALYKQTVGLSPGRNSFCMGLKNAIIGFLILLLPLDSFKVWKEDLGTIQGEEEGGGLPFSPAERIQQSSRERSWLRQLRELAEASFNKDDAGAFNDSTGTRNFSGRFWTGKRSGSSSITSSNDFKAKGDIKAKSKGLHKDLESIFSSK